MTRIILASSSPRRKILLEEMGYVFDIEKPMVNESSVKEQNPEKLAVKLAKMKAIEVADKFPDSLVIGSDTVVAANHDEILGKPDDATHAVEILKSLSGTAHRVISGICVYEKDKGNLFAGCETTWVQMRKMTDQEIQDYVDSGEALGKAGAYAIQENGDKFATVIKGGFENVVGLPVDLLKAILTHRL